MLRQTWRPGVLRRIRLWRNASKNIVFFDSIPSLGEMVLASDGDSSGAWFDGHPQPPSGPAAARACRCVAPQPKSRIAGEHRVRPAAG
jgi:hypothetical protein